MRNLILSGRCDGDDPSSAARLVERFGLHLSDDILGGIIRNLTKNDMLAVKMGCFDKGDEELGA